MNQHGIWQDASKLSPVQESQVSGRSDKGCKVKGVGGLPEMILFDDIFGAISWAGMKFGRTLAYLAYP